VAVQLAQEQGLAVVFWAQGLEEASEQEWRLVSLLSHQNLHRREQIVLDFHRLLEEVEDSLAPFQQAHLEEMLAPLHAHSEGVESASALLQAEVRQVVLQHGMVSGSGRDRRIR